MADGVSIDTRTLHEGDLFVALKGPNHDGHRFIPDALAAGAAAVVAERLPEGTPADAPALLVEDTQAALEALARAARARSRARVVAVTGSVGKTGTKEVLRQCLAAQGKTHASVGSLNNHWGVPLSLARLPADADYAVFELGMNHPGEITPLTRMVCPDVAVITTIAAAHTAFFGSLDENAKAKAEISQGVVLGGAAVLPRDNPYFNRLAEMALNAGVARIIGFGDDAEADARLLDCSLHARCSAVTTEIKGETYDYCLSLPGAHWVTNSIAVLAAVAALGADVGKAAGEMAHLRPVAGRGERHEVRLPGGTVEVIDDSYNANPASMRAAISVLGQGRQDGGRLIAVLGDMLELGADSATCHSDLLYPLNEAGVDLIFTCGEEMAALDAVLPLGIRGGHAATAAELAPAVTEAVRAGDTVLVKGSAGAQTGRIVQALLAMDRDDLPKAANGE
jgi:UDP-N-acetylmuramoyl-tripeptide--D-alanyl-D-alanine ligase